MNRRTLLFFAGVAPAVILLLAVIFIGCAKKSGEPEMFTGRTVSRDAVSLATDGAQTGKLSYAEVNSAWLAWAYDDFRRELSAGPYGVTGWDDRSQCTLFASSFEVYCQKRYHAQAFHSRISAPGIAVGTRWYSPTDDTGHALNIVFTERGVVDFEPQTGRIVTLTPAQRRSSSLMKFD